MTERNTLPSNKFELLRRALKCNKEELAEHLGVSSKTLRAWEATGGNENAANKIAAVWLKIAKQIE